MLFGEGSSPANSTIGVLSAGALVRSVDAHVEPASAWYACRDTSEQGEAMIADGWMPTAPVAPPIGRGDLSHLLHEMAAHDRVGALLDAPDPPLFLSGWDVRHPFVGDILGDLLVEIGATSSRLTSYSHMDEDPELAERLADLHAAYGEAPCAPERFAPGAGSSAFLTTILQHLRRRGEGEICYVPPVYYNAIYWIRDLGFHVTRTCAGTPIETAELDLPDRRTVLWISDPLWFAGIPVPGPVMDQVSEWQERTGSTVVVDGTFAYMEWDGPRPARAASLDPDLTIRLVCPTKALAIHGFRFAYAIVPAAEATEFQELHGRAHGASSLPDRLFAHRATAALRSSLASRTVWPYARERYEQVVRSRELLDHVPPTSGYFVFGRPQRTAGVTGLDAGCFEATDRPGHLRVNLLDDHVFGHLVGGDRSTEA